MGKKNNNGGLIEVIRSETSERPSGVFVLSVKFGAVVPMDRVILRYCLYVKLNIN